MASESMAQVRPSALWTIDSESIRARGIIVKYSNRLKAKPVAYIIKNLLGLACSPIGFGGVLVLILTLTKYDVEKMEVPIRCNKEVAVE